MVNGNTFVGRVPVAASSSALWDRYEDESRSSEMGNCPMGKLWGSFFPERLDRQGAEEARGRLGRYAPAYGSGEDSSSGRTQVFSLALVDSIRGPGVVINEWTLPAGRDGPFVTVTIGCRQGSRFRPIDAALFDQNGWTESS